MGVPRVPKLLYYTIYKPKNSLCFSTYIEDHDLNTYKLNMWQEARMKSEDCMCVVWMLSCGLLFEGYTHDAYKLSQHILQLITNNNQQATASPSAATPFVS